MSKTYRLDEIECFKRYGRYDSFCCSSSNVRRYFSVNMPKINCGHKVYEVNYRDYTEDNKVSLRLTYDISKPSKFKEAFCDVFSQLSNFDLGYVAEKIIKISEIHCLSYSKYYKPEFSKIGSKYITVITDKGKFILNNIKDESVKVKQIYINKTFALVGGFIMELGLGDFEYKNDKLVRSEKINIYEFNDKYKNEDLEAKGFVFNPPQDISGWELPTSRVDAVVQIHRPIMEDAELQKYISENIDNVNYNGMKLNKKIDLC